MKINIIFFTTIFISCHQNLRENLPPTLGTPKDTLLFVDYTKTPQKLLKKYPGFEGDFSEISVPLEKIGKREIVSVKLFIFNSDSLGENLQNVKKEMEIAGFRPANVFELVSLVASNCEVARDIPIISPCPKELFAGTFVPYIGSWYSMYYTPYGFKWINLDYEHFSNWRFLGVRKYFVKSL